MYLYIQGSHCAVITKLLDCGFEVIDFKLQLLYYILFWTNILWEKALTLLSPYL